MVSPCQINTSDIDWVNYATKTVLKCLFPLTFLALPAAQLLIVFSSLSASQTPDQALQQVLLLQSQYGQLEENEMAATVAANGADLSQVDRAVNMARGLRSRMDIDIQLGILRDSQLALELSETTVCIQRPLLLLLLL